MREKRILGQPDLYRLKAEDVGDRSIEPRLLALPKVMAERSVEPVGERRRDVDRLAGRSIHVPIMRIPAGTDNCAVRRSKAASPRSFAHCTSDETAESRCAAVDDASARAYHRRSLPAPTMIRIAL